MSEMERIRKFSGEKKLGRCSSIKRGITDGIHRLGSAYARYGRVSRNVGRE